MAEGWRYTTGVRLNIQRLLIPVALLVVAAMVVLATSLWVRHQGREAENPYAHIGGDFTLASKSGPVSLSAFNGKVVLLFFGYTHCPDVCPRGLQLISEAKEWLGPEAGNVQPLMISVDPERDTIEVLADYVSNFHPSIIGLTGAVEKIKAVASAYKAYFAKGEVDKHGDYFMDHSPFIYLMGPNGQYLAHFVPNTSPKVIATRIKSAIAES